MKIVINNNGEHIPATLEVVDGVMIVSPDKGNVDISQFKDGDVLYIRSGFPWICIYKEGGEKENVYHKYVAITSLTITHDDSALCCRKHVEEIRFATEEEKQKLFDALAKEGKAWDAEKKAVVELKWKPKSNDDYFAPIFSYAANAFITTIHVWVDLIYDKDIYNIGWCFKTKEECEAYCKRLNDVIKEVKP